MKRFLLFLLMLMFTSSLFPTMSRAESEQFKVLFKANDVSEATSTLQPFFKIVNSGNSSIKLQKVKIRYWFTSDTLTAALTLSWHWASVNGVSGTLVKLDQTKDKSNYYFEENFSADSGSLDPGKTVEIQNGIVKSTWTNFIQSNDFSFNNSASTYIENTKVSVYMNGKLVSGTEPTDAPASDIIKLNVLYKAEDVSLNCNALKPDFEIINTSTDPIALSRVKIRYWFTRNVSKAALTSICYWAGINGSNLTQNVTRSIVNLQSPFATGRYLL
jgi:endoglucanase